jgi:hypothetical protein
MTHRAEALEGTRATSGASQSVPHSQDASRRSVDQLRGDVEYNLKNAS